MSAGTGGGEGSGGLMAHLRQLRECLEEGLISEADFEREKASLLQSSRPGA